MKKPLVFACWILILAVLSSCNLPGQFPQTTDSESPPGQDELVATLVAATLAAQPTAEIPLSPSDTPPPPETNTPEATATITLTPTPGVPTVSVSVATNCRTGPSTQFDQIGALGVGQSAEVVGRYQNGQYWIIKNPNRSGECWLWGNYATVSGNTANLPEYPVPPTPTPSPTPTLAPPAPVNNLTVNKVCILAIPGVYNYTGDLNWEDKSDNEDGFNIYRQDVLLTSVPANTTSYPIHAIPLAAGTPLKFGVEAFNAAGKAAIKEVTFSCP